MHELNRCHSGLEVLCHTADRFLQHKCVDERVLTKMELHKEIRVTQNGTDFPAAKR